MKKLTSRLKESDISFIGIAAILMLYVMNILGTGIIVGGDVGHIGSGIPFYGFIAPTLLIAFSCCFSYYTKKYSLKKAYKRIYLVMLLPFIAYPFSYIFGGTPLLLLPMLLCMPIGSLFYYLDEEICSLMGIATYEASWLIIAIIALLLLPVILAPLVYRFTKPLQK